MKVLVVGGAGYIGSHMVKMLSQAGHDVVTLDNLSNGYENAVRYGQFVKGDIADAVFYCASCPAHVQIAEMIIFPTAQRSATVVGRRE